MIREKLMEFRYRGRNKDLVRKHRQLGQLVAILTLDCCDANKDNLREVCLRVQSSEEEIPEAYRVRRDVLEGAYLEGFDETLNSFRELVRVEEPKALKYIDIGFHG